MKNVSFVSMMVMAGMILFAGLFVAKTAKNLVNNINSNNHHTVSVIAVAAVRG